MKIQCLMNATLMIKIALVNINVLDLKDVCKEENLSLAACINNGKLPNLTHLSISMWKYVRIHRGVQTSVRTQIKNILPIWYFEAEDGIKKLSLLKCYNLNNLLLNRFFYCTSHLLTAAMTTQFSQLSQLDISHSSGISGKLYSLVGYSFPSLKDLILRDYELNPQNLLNLAKASLKGILYRSSSISEP